VSWIYRTLVRPGLFACDSEEIHNRTLRGLSWISRRPIVRELAGSLFSAPALPTELFGLKFPNPVGLAAGMDKDAVALPAWEALGFGFVELGAVTFHPQPGNPAPRLFRIVPDGALINRMGFNNEGAETIARRLAEWRGSGLWPKHPVGVNLGKSKVTPLNAAAEDYRKSFEALWAELDFFVINVSSPNTPQLRELQDRGALEEILIALQEANDRFVSRAQSGSENASRPGARGVIAPQRKPILIKVAPDLSWAALDAILELATERAIAGLVATNTTIERPKRARPELTRIYQETGGLSGRPLRERSTEVIRHIFRRSEGKMPIIGVGGIFSSMDAWEKLTAGASLVQVYTGLVYEGPGLVRELVRGLQERLSRQGLKEVREAVGIGGSPLG